jgi:hypothetical protein
MRTHRNPNSANRQTHDPQGILGAEQLRWLKKELSRSRAVWKVIAADMPLGLVVADGPTDFEAVANGDPGAPLGRELQIAELLRYIKHRRVTGTVWLTADVHYTSAQHYQPSRAAFTDFEPTRDRPAPRAPESAFAKFSRSRFASMEPILIEAPFSLRVGDAMVDGRIDAVYEPEGGLWEVVDFKSGRAGDDPRPARRRLGPAHAR